MYVDIISRSIQSGTDFEVAVTNCLNHLGFDAHRTGNNDNGVDIVASIELNGKKYSFNIQCKFFNTTLGKGPVQEIFTGSHYYNNGGKPVLITNNIVSANARTYASNLKVEVIANGEWVELKQVQDTKQIINPNVHHGLMGIMISRILEDDGYLIKSIEDNSENNIKNISDKEQLKMQIGNDLDSAKEYFKTAAELNQKAAQLQQKAIELQKSVIFRNIDYG